MTLEEYCTKTFKFEKDTNILYRFYLGVWKEVKLKPCTNGYIRVSAKDGKQVAVHRLIWFLVHGEFPTLEVDHINNVRSDNRPDNLRIVTRTQNQSNRLPTKKSKSRYKGVYPVYKNRWASTISFNGVKHYVGYFNCETAAAIAYNKKAKELDNEYRKINT